jgi:hypothetical protein
LGIGIMAFDAVLFKKGTGRQVVRSCCKLDSNESGEKGGKTHI